MRFGIPALAFLGVGALALAVAADPAPTTQPERTATPAAIATDSASPATSAATGVPAPPASSPTASQPAAPKSSAQALSAEEQGLLSKGYKPQMRNGEKIYCRREAELGSRISAVQHCGTVAQLTTRTQESKDFTDKVQRTPVNPMGGH